MAPFAAGLNLALLLQPPLLLHCRSRRPTFAPIDEAVSTKAEDSEHNLPAPPLTSAPSVEQHNDNIERLSLIVVVVVVVVLDRRGAGLRLGGQTS